MLEVVVDDPPNNSLCFGAVADELSLRHIEFALMGADCIDIALFRTAGVSLNHFVARAALIVQRRVRLRGSKAHAVAGDFALCRPPHCAGHNKQRASGVVVGARLPLVGEKGLTLKIAVELVGERAYR